MGSRCDTEEGARAGAGADGDKRYVVGDGDGDGDGVHLPYYHYLLPAVDG